MTMDINLEKTSQTLRWKKSGDDHSETGDRDLGPEDDGRALDTDMEELGYAEL